MAFPDDRDRHLQQVAFKTLAVANDLIDWIGDHNPVRRANGVGVIRTEEEFQLLTLRRRASSMFRSSKVPVAAAVYGPSQVGKSLFVGRVLQPQDPNFSPLGRDENAGPPAYYPHLSFDLDLNPQCGNAEATAIVSRFTTKDRFDEDAGKLKNYAVLVRGLSRAEWLRVLARGFRSECEIPDRTFVWANTELEDLFIQACDRSRADTVDREWRMDLLDVYTYLKRLDPTRYKADEAFFNGLLSRYALGSDGYTEIAASLCWPGSPQLTDLFQRINVFLDKIRKGVGKRDGMLCHWAAVRFLLDSQQKYEHESPNSRHFTKVQWGDIVDKYEDGWYVLDYQPGKGPPSELLTTIQSAMLEMVIPVLPDRLNEEWRDVLANIDFLDIPGLKAGGQSTEGAVSKTAESHETQMNVVKRGKVFYLFERYIDELQAQTLLMLIRGGAIGVRGELKMYVDKWGRMRYGKDEWPQRVKYEERLPAFFLGMTGIDEEFEKNHPTPALYEARLKDLVHGTFVEIMTDFGGKGQPFTNVYPIRYPGTLDNNEERRQKLGVDLWTRAGQAFLASPLVQRYVAEAPRKWAAAMRDGDGGSSLIAEAFRLVTSSDRKQTELEKGLEDTRNQLSTLARMWVVKTDVQEDRARRISFARKILDWLTNDAHLVYRRVRALQEALSIQDGVEIPISDFAEIQPADRNNPMPISKRLPEALKAFLRNWGTKLAPDRWHDYTKDHNDAGKGIDAETFAELTRYLVEYLTSDYVFPRLCERVQQVVMLNIKNNVDLRYARRKFVRLILNDYILNPGDGPPPPLTPPPRDDQPDDPPAPAKPGPATPGIVSTGNDAAAAPKKSSNAFGLMTSFVERWQARLPGVLAAGAGNAIEIPDGNDQLVTLLKTHKA